MTLLEWMAVIAGGLFVLLVVLLAAVLLYLWNLDSDLSIYEVMFGTAQVAVPEKRP